MIVELRKERDAPVDVVGCEKLSEPCPGEDREFQILVSLMLSSQTKDPITAEAVANLRAHGLTISNILNTPDETINHLIRRVGFHNNKTKFLKQTAQMLQDKFNSRVPRTVAELTSLPGVGPKMAYIALDVAFGIVAGIGVDTHVHRICNLLRWVKTKTPEQTRIAVEKWLPRDLWGQVNLLFVGFGQQLQADQMRLVWRAVHASDPQFALRLVIRLGAKIDAIDKKAEGGPTALTHAARQGDAAAVALLLEHGADPYKRDGSGTCAADLKVGGEAGRLIEEKAQRKGRKKVSKRSAEPQVKAEEPEVEEQGAEEGRVVKRQRKDTHLSKPATSGKRSRVKREEEVQVKTEPDAESETKEWMAKFAADVTPVGCLRRSGLRGAVPRATTRHDSI
eukprot:c13522_g1_i1.p1 GENE.c13522_g1_i1~~c13522_g1_i1.p1  ORF type:complete len:446 (+),score=94.52 c13522_g1_i1:159-1340(+)